MPLDAFFVVLASAVLHAVWNALAKGGKRSDPRINALLIGIGGACTGGPLLIAIGLPAPASWPYLLASALIHVAYFLLAGAAYRAADLSSVYPITRGCAPAGAAIIAWLLLGEALHPLAWAGVLLVGVGVVTMAFAAGGLSRTGLAFALANACVVILYTVVDGQGARLSGNPAAYVMAMEALNAPLLLPILYLWTRRTGLAPALAEGVWWRCLLGGALSLAAYAAALWAMTRAPIGLVAALRETSVLFGVIIAAVVLRENVGRARWAAACIILLGVIAVRIA